MQLDSMQQDILNRTFSGHRRYSTLRMAPMIDMIFLLLIFFLVSAKWRPEETFLSFQLPAAQAMENRPGKPEPLLIHIFAAETGCDVRIGSMETIQIQDQTLEADLAVLMEKMQECMFAQKRFVSDPVEIICEPQVKWDYLTKIYNLFSGAGLTDITLPMTE
jgi:biopolymer transport protein ExbD